MRNKTNSIENCNHGKCEEGTVTRPNFYLFRAVDTLEQIWSKKVTDSDEKICKMSEDETLVPPVS